MSFNRFLETMLTWATFNKFGTKRKDHSPWMYTPAANTIFTVARERVYKQVVVAKDKDKDKGKSSGAAGAGNGSVRRTGGVDEDGVPLDLDEDDFGAEEEAIMREMEEAEEDNRKREAAKDPRRTWWLPNGAEPVLEEQPKWGLLQEVLDEVEQHMYWGDGADSKPARRGGLVSPMRVLIELSMSRAQSARRTTRSW